MCGILGVVFRDPRRLPDADRVAAARNTLRHRGPDEQGLWVRPGVALAHQRLRVLDLTQGQQPMVDEAAGAALVYNGEVYNFRELQGHYRPSGLAFDTRCDTELVFKALNHEGEAALPRFNGMFALGHWSEAERALLLVRDRLGKKPLYWFADDEQLVFASELKAILVYLDRKFPIDPTALDQFFARGYVLSPRTIFRGIQKLPAGHLLRLSAKGGWSCETKSYWDFTPREVPSDPQEALDGLDELLTDAVRMRLVSDVPIGCLLSGGIDSSLVTALAAKVSSEPIRAFSIGFDESAEHNELPYAEMVAKRHGCKWFHRSVRGGDFLAMVDEASHYYDEPFGNFTMFSMRRLAEMAREQLVVVLTGQGGDELAGGYPGRYNWVVETAAAAANRTGASKYAPAVDDLLSYFRASSFLPWPGGREAILSHDLREAIARAGSPTDDTAPFWNRHAALGRLNNVLYTDVKTNLADYLICLEERMTMSVSLEARNPLLDYRVVEYLLSLPETMKIREGRNKWALLELARRYVPAEAIDRPKRGFTPPLNLWIQGNAERLAEVFRESDSQVSAAFSPAWRQYLRSGRYEPGTVMPMFYSLMLAAWVKHYGRYIASWPGEYTQSTPVSIDIRPGAGETRPNGVFRRQDSAAISEARWFCQAMGNLTPGTRVVILGDHAEWFGFLATGSQLEVVAEDAEALIVIGFDAVQQLTKQADATPESLREGGSLLWFVPFDVSQQKAAQALPSLLTQHGFTIKGHQAVPLSAQRGVMIARGTAAASSGVVASAPTA